MRLPVSYCEVGKGCAGMSAPNERVAPAESHISVFECTHAHARTRTHRHTHTHTHAQVNRQGNVPRKKNCHGSRKSVHAWLCRAQPRLQRCMERVRGCVCVCEGGCLDGVVHADGKDDHLNTTNKRAMKQWSSGAASCEQQHGPPTGDEGGEPLPEGVLKLHLCRNGDAQLLSLRTVLVAWVVSVELPLVHPGPPRTDTDACVGIDG